MMGICEIRKRSVVRIPFECLLECRAYISETGRWIFQIPQNRVMRLHENESIEWIFSESKPFASISDAMLLGERFL
jgi:hypothetical protein